VRVDEGKAVRRKDRVVIGGTKGMVLSDSHSPDYLFVRCVVCVVQQVRNDGLGKFRV
jgi:hypothetical protein